MAFDTIIGQTLAGKQLPTVPPNAQPQEQIAVLNSIIDKLNNNTQEVVGAASVTLGISGAIQQVFTFAHNLGYHPRVYAFMNSVDLTVGSLPTYRKVDIPLPSPLTTSVAGGGGGGAIPVTFESWLDFFMDSNNVYFRIINPNATVINLPVTYYLTRQASN